MKEFLKCWKWYELVFLVISLTTITVCFIVGADKNVMSLITSIIGVVVVLMTAKGLVLAPFVNIGYNVLYSIIAIAQHYYGEAIIYIALMIPINVVTIITWLKNRNKADSNVVAVNKIHGMEYLYLAIATAVATVGFYFILQALHTSELIISTVSLISSAVASYLMLRRCKYYALAFIANDVVLITMWSLVVKNSGIAYLPTVVCFCVFLINDIYGFVHWMLEEKKQKNVVETEKEQEISQ